MDYTKDCPWWIYFTRDFLSQEASMRKAISVILVSVLSLALLIYTGYRSWSFVTMTLPADRQWLAVFALFALDGGLVLWLANFLWGAEGSYQRAVSLIMTLVDLAGATILAGVDTVYTTGTAGLTTKMAAGDILFAELALSAIVLMNVAATVIFHLTDPAVRKRAAQQEAQDVINEMAMKQVEEASPRLGAELAPQIAQAWYGDMRSRYQANLNIFEEKPQFSKFRNIVTPAQTVTHKPAAPEKQVEKAPPPLSIRRQPVMTGTRQPLKALRNLNAETPLVELTPAPSSNGHKKAE